MPLLPSDRSGAVVIGGANLDVRARSTSPALPATSNPGTVTMAPGGVGRNVAETLARLGTPVRLVAAVGRDDPGERLLTETAAAGVDVEHVVRTDQPTGSYVAVLGADGELVVAVSDMAGTDQLCPDDVRRVEPLVAAAAVLVLDGNLSTATLDAALEVAAAAGTPVLLDPVSVPKAARLAPLLGSDLPLLAVTPNLAELGALTGRDADDESELPAATADLHRLGIEHVWARLGAAGSILSTGGRTVRLPAVPGPVIDVTGAGDAMLAAYCHALLAGSTPVAAARLGHAAAALTIAVPQTTRTDLSPTLLEQTLADAPALTETP
ncbi:MAG: carbohydrate kinase family protein [Nocardioides sp.]